MHRRWRQPKSEEIFCCPTSYTNDELVRSTMLLYLMDGMMPKATKLEFRDLCASRSLFSRSTATEDVAQASLTADLRRPEDDHSTSCFRARGAALFMTSKHSIARSYEPEPCRSPAARHIVLAPSLLERAASRNGYTEDSDGLQRCRDA